MMKTAWVKCPFEVQIRNTEIPKLKPGEVLMKVEACGICGTDLHFARTLAESWMPLGHEAVGIIERVADSSDEKLVGSRVVALNYTACNQCDACKNGNWAYCTAMPSYMEESQGWQAGVAEYLVLRKDMVFPYAKLDPIVATLVEPASVAMDLVETAGVPLGADVVVFGPGPIGLLAIRIAKLKGARRVFATVAELNSKRSRKRAEVAKKFGADEVIDLSRENLVERMQSLCPAGVDRVMITAPPRTLPDAIHIAKFGGVIGLIGIEYGSGSKVEIDVNEFHFKKLQLRASHAIPDVRFPKILTAFQDLSIDAAVLATHVFKIEDSAEALKIAASKDEPVIKVVIDCR